MKLDGTAPPTIADEDKRLPKGKQVTWPDRQPGQEMERISHLDRP